MRPTFQDRRDAGRALGGRLLRYGGRPGVLVLALPRGGVPVGYEVARALNAPMDVFVVRKLGVPGHEELAMGAIASGGVRVLNESVIRHLGIGKRTVDEVAEEELRELERREREYRRDREGASVAGKTVILVDDGLATGATMKAAAHAVRQMRPARVVVAVPTASDETCEEFEQDAAIDEIVCMTTPEPFYAVGLSYQDFSQTTDEEVRELLAAARQPRLPHGTEGGGATDRPAAGG
jgi:predicted phosphoribosyltransferase